ncbi:hypothetical protein [Microbacterium oleivorans]|uniref:Uncharacterized protein n=1 Tax=Microbacterium oleivorans TaxID=273677 RepID=A0A4R5YKA7_9MICO|nr:hypothetical protein [Microbacterium oleivorans]TDL43847.1 hypothetical protein E2R54_11700 [Microbacterium oleivorans]
MFNTTAAQNQAHRNDLGWIKVGRSEYMRGDGVTIRKHERIAQFWLILLPSGEQAAMPKMVAPGEFYSALPAAGHSLTDAKYHAENVTADAPAYAPVKR